MSDRQSIEVRYPSDVAEAGRLGRAAALALGFDERRAEELALVARELASNLLRHAAGGTLTLLRVVEGNQVGLQVESRDQGPGIPDPEQAVADGYSTAGGLGYGLGTVNRLMDSLSIVSPAPEGGTWIVCRRWLRTTAAPAAPCPVDVGAATRPHPAMTVNGDAFAICRAQGGMVLALIDGLGHGHFAHRAAQAARQYVEGHYERPLAEIFHGAARACRGTRGVVMALARIDPLRQTLAFASIGNIEARLVGGPHHSGFVVRRGILGVQAPSPVVTEHPWRPGLALILHTDGLRSHWKWADFAQFRDEPAPRLAHLLLHRLAKDDDDATVLVAKSTAAPNAGHD